MLLLLGAVVATILLAPRISESKRERAERDRREAAAARAERIRRMRIEIRPRRGAGGVAQLEAAITADSARRVRAGDLPTRPRGTQCRRLGTSGGGVLFSCTAVTSEIRGAGSGVIGYPFRARIDSRSGHFAFCKVSGQPGEGFLERGGGVRLPAPCGG